MIAHAYKRENGVTKEAIVIEWAAAAAWWKLGGCEKAMARCTTRCEMLLFRAKTIMRDWGHAELARLKKKKERRKKNNLPVLRVPGAVLSRRFFATRGVLLVMKTLEDERYVVIIESVDSICRDTTYTQYMLIQKNLTKSQKRHTYKPF